MFAIKNSETQGITGEEAKRTASSAGAFYPLEIYLVAATIKGLVPGIYHYRSVDHSLQKIAEGDKRKQLSAAVLMQVSVRHCAAVIVFAAHFSRITKKYFERGKYYGYIETGTLPKMFCCNQFLYISVP